MHRSRFKWAIAVLLLLLVLGPGLWFAATRGVRSYAESILTRALGAPVRIERVDLAGGPLRVTLVGVHVQEDEIAIASADKVVVRGGALALLRGELAEARVVVWKPRAEAASANRQAAFVEKVRNAGEEHVRIASVQLRDWPLGTTSTTTVPTLELSDLEISRSEGRRRLVAQLEQVEGTGQLQLDFGETTGTPSVSAELTVIGVSVEDLLRIEGWELGGVAEGELRYQAVWDEEAPKHSVQADLSIREMEAVDGDGDQLVFSDVHISELRLDEDPREIMMAELVAEAGEITPGLLRRLHETITADGAWAVRIPSAQITDLRILGDDIATVSRLHARNVGTPWQTGAVELDAVAAETRLRLTLQRDDPDELGTANVLVDGLDLSQWFDGEETGAADLGGIVDLDVTLSGPPGIQGSGVVRLRDLASSVSGEKLLEADELAVDLEYVSVRPLRLRVRSASIVRPQIWVRYDEDGFQLQSLWDDGMALAPAAAAQHVFAAVNDWAGEAPQPESRPGPVRVELTGGSITGDVAFAGSRVTLEFADVSAQLEGPAGPAGPVDIDLTAGSPQLGGVRFGGQASPAGLKAEGELGPIQLAGLNGVLSKLIGFAFERGTMSIGANSRLEPAPAMNVRILLDGVALQSEPAPKRDPLGKMLGAPLPKVLSRVQSPPKSGQLDLSLEGDWDQPYYGLLRGFPQALQVAVRD